jgi:hypothetical protein
VLFKPPGPFFSPNKPLAFEIEVHKFDKIVRKFRKASTVKGKE